MNKIVSDKAVIREMSTDELIDTYNHKLKQYGNLTYSEHISTNKAKQLSNELRFINSQYFQQTGKHLLT